MERVWLVIHQDYHGNVVRGAWASHAAAAERGIPACIKEEAGYHGGDPEAVPQRITDDLWAANWGTIRLQEIEVQF